MEPRHPVTNFYRIFLLEEEEVKRVPVTGPIMAQRVGSGIALPFHDRATRRG